MHDDPLVAEPSSRPPPQPGRQVLDISHVLADEQRRQRVLDDALDDARVRAAEAVAGFSVAGGAVVAIDADEAVREAFSGVTKRDRQRGDAGDLHRRLLSAC